MSILFEHLLILRLSKLGIYILELLARFLHQLAITASSRANLLNGVCSIVFILTSLPFDLVQRNDGRVWCFHSVVVSIYGDRVYIVDIDIIHFGIYLDLL